jgi:hypothetical protein
MGYIADLHGFCRVAWEFTWFALRSTPTVLNDDNPASQDSRI